jgi:hypothetical protein
MNEDHIKEIAAKADQLIEIIQNIKDKVHSSQDQQQPNIDLRVAEDETNSGGGGSWW